MNRLNNHPKMSNSDALKKKEFMGFNYQKNNCIQCFICNNYHPNYIHLPNINYCAHCWAWLNSEQLNLIDGIYNGETNINEIINLLKLTYSHHPNTCNNNECIYNKIKQYKSENRLNAKFNILFENDDDKKRNIIINNNNKKDENKLNKCIIKNRHIMINYKLSSITI